MGADDTRALPQSPVQLLLRQKVPAVRELVRVACTGCVVLLLGAGLAGRVEELHEFSETVGNLGRERDIFTSAKHDILCEQSPVFHTVRR